ncbi:MAG: glycosyltransferase family 2 protein [Hydrococcus sp. RM1_1_31]|nr:glycosyltransferase family 2 protein [Hydrococcus sp. RM1_1_31]
MKFKLNTNQYRDYLSIAPVPDGVYRPFWSVMIPNYNCTHYLVQTLKSVLEQDPGSEVMQIEVLDNCSTQDDPEAIVNEIGKGRVFFFFVSLKMSVCCEILILAFREREVIGYTSYTATI